MKINQFFIAFALLVSISLHSCKTDKDDVVPAPAIMAKDALILNEGGFGKNNGTISFYYNAKDSIANNIYAKANGETTKLGDVVQSAVIVDTLCYIVVNNSNKIVVVNLRNFKKVKEISDFIQPRYCLVLNNKLYVTCWGDMTTAGYVSVRSLPTFTEDKKITVGSGPEQLINVQNKIYVANSGGYGKNTTVSVIDAPTNDLSTTITGLANNPNAFALDMNNALWVLCAGSTDYDPITYAVIAQSPAKLHKINTSNNTADAGLLIPDDNHPTKLAISKDKLNLFYGTGSKGIFKMSISASSAPTTPFINKKFYSFNINPANDEIYALDAKNYTVDGEMTRYRADGTLIKTYTVGLIPSNVVFVN